MIVGKLGSRKLTTESKFCGELNRSHIPECPTESRSDGTKIEHPHQSSRSREKTTVGGINEGQDNTRDVKYEDVTEPLQRGFLFFAGFRHHPSNTYIYSLYRR